MTHRAPRSALVLRMLILLLYVVVPSVASTCCVPLTCSSEVPPATETLMGWRVPLRPGGRVEQLSEGQELGGYGRLQVGVIDHWLVSVLRQLVICHQVRPAACVELIVARRCQVSGAGIPLDGSRADPSASGREVQGRQSGHAATRPQRHRAPRAGQSGGRRQRPGPAACQVSLADEWRAGGRARRAPGGPPKAEAGR